MTTRLRNRIIDFRRDSKQYFTEAQDEIKQMNILAMRRESLLALVVFLVLISITPILFEDWSFVWEYSILWISFLAAVPLSYILEKRKASYRVVQGCCAMYCSIFMIGIVLVSVFPFPDAPASLIYMSFMVVPIAFVLPFSTLAVILTVSEVAFVVLVLYCKTTAYWSFDVFTSVASYLVAMVLTTLLCNLTVTNALTKMKYKNLSVMDDLTGLYNKSAFEYECKSFFSNHSNMDCALIMVDIDNFKEINDQNGHEIGDEVLEIIGQCIHGTFRGEDITGRFGGDEYLILMTNVSDKKLIEQKIRQLMDTLEEKTKSMLNFPISCSCGVLIGNGRKLYYEEWLRMADTLMYHVKKNGKNSCMVLNHKEFHAHYEIKKQMLIVEDEVSGRQILSRIFQDEYDIVLAKDGLQAKEQIKKYGNQISVVLLDLIMPNMSGQELLKWMKEHDSSKNIPVIVLTSDRTAELSVLELGCDDMVSKPYDAKVLTARVRNIMKRLEEMETKR